MRTLKGILIIAGLFIITTTLMVYDPLGLNKDGLNGESLWAILYAIPAVVVGIIVESENTLSSAI